MKSTNILDWYIDENLAYHLFTLPAYDEICASALKAEKDFRQAMAETTLPQSPP